MPKLLSIGEVAKSAGIRPSALRYYESVGLLLPTAARQSGQRRYEPGILRQIAFIQAAQATGFSIAEIRSLLDDSGPKQSYSERLQLLAALKLAEVDKLISHAQTIRRVLQAGLECRCASHEECLLFVKASDGEGNSGSCSTDE